MFSRAGFHDLTHIHDADPVSEEPDCSEIVRDVQVSAIVRILDITQQIEDLSLGRKV